MSIARHHNEWLSLIEISGPFLSLPILMRTFPQGLDALDREKLAEVRLAYEEWIDDQNSLRPSPAIHSVWVRYILEKVLDLETENLLEGQAIPSNLQAYIAEQGETLRPDLMVRSNEPSEPKPRMLLQIYPMAQGLEKSMQNHRWKASPAMRMLELQRATGVQLGLVTNGEQWMLVNAPKGETSAFISWYAALWMEEPLTFRAFSSLLNAYRFFSVADEDTLEGMLKNSANEQQEVTDQLGYQVRSAVEVLIRSIDKADQDYGRSLLKEVSEKDLYEAALTVMMRLVFLFSAEERGLLLLGDSIYDQNYAVSTLRAQLRETADQQGEEVLERSFDAWCRLLATFRAVYAGIHHDRLNLPAYGGSLFNPDCYPFLEGKTSHGNGENGVLPISNRTVLHLLDALQILRVKVPGGGPAEPRRLSFRSLDVEQIGHVYEGLLDHIAIRAKDMVLGLSGTRDKEPEISLSTLMAEESKGDKSFIAFLKDQTGRTQNAISKALEQNVDIFANQQLLIACNNDTRMVEQIGKFAGLLREDDFGYPVVFLPGSVYVTSGATRRATGTHYTPRSLTEPIVQHTLEPLVYIGPAEGFPQDQWKLKTPTEILTLKVCDMAMGSAGFLVQVIRYMSERLVEAWDMIAPEGKNLDIRITPEGTSASGKPGELIIPKDVEERLVLARRLVADRCIYGVDKNPLAVEIAKLSIWLTTMDKGRPFTFLDHALKCGDSLVGADEDMFRQWAFSRKDAAFTLDLEVLNQHLELARQKRKELESFTVLDVRDADHKAELLKEADATMARVKLGCDLLVGVRLFGLKSAEQEELLSRLLWDYVAESPMDGYDAQHAVNAAFNEQAFHWQFEFPEVFEKGGFNAIVGNPPFLGGKRISTVFGDIYLDYLKTHWSHTAGSADICAYFFLQAYNNLQNNGRFGLIATNTIAEGDTRDVGLDYIFKNGGTITHTVSNTRWPGSANVAISIVIISKGKYIGKITLDEVIVKSISSRLDDQEFISKPYRLKSNVGKSYVGSYLWGKGFVLTETEARSLIKKDSKNREVIFPYLVGEDINRNPSQKASKWVINFFDWPLDQASIYSDCLNILLEKVKPEREKVKRAVYRDLWWQFAEKQRGLYDSIRPLSRVLIAARVTKYINFVFVDNGQVYNEKTVIACFDKYIYFALLQSCFHDHWVRTFTSTLGTAGINYSPTDVLETFPFPSQIMNLEIIGADYHEHRRQIMLLFNEGLTPFYNRFHNPKERAEKVNKMRDFQVEMDYSVANAYDWSDLELEHGFHETQQGIRFTISEKARREVLMRLLKLNHERYEEEIRQGLHEKDKKKSKKEKLTIQKPKKVIRPEGQLNFIENLEKSGVIKPMESSNTSRTSEINDWDSYKCLACGKILMGFSIEEHTQSVHQGKDPEYRKI